jgi:outer membrane receptor protein involved in Fe transport
MKINKRALIMTGVALTALGSAFAITPAFAQDAAPVADDAQATTVVVTGTRIRRPNLKSASPITTVDTKEVKLQGAIAVDSVLKALPQIEAGNNENQSNNSDGTAGVNLRSLGGNRSLVLIDGQRFLPTLGVDLNFIPSSLVERTDVLTGGASSVYGSDAMSGVVNFIMRKKLNGIKFDSQYSIYQHNNDDDYLRGIQTAAGITPAKENVWDGQKYDFNISFGSNLEDGKGNVTGYFGYRKMEAVRQDARDYSNCALEFNDPDGSTFRCGGSSSHAFGRFRPLTITMDDGTVIDSPGKNTDYANSKDGSKTWVPNDPSFNYNYAPDNYTLRNSERYNAGFFANYKVNEHVEAYGSFMFMDDHSVSQVAPSAIWAGRAFDVNCDNPFLSAQQGAILCGAAYGTDAIAQTQVVYRAATGPGRRNDMRHTDYRLAGGFRGAINDAWSYDASYMYATTIGQFNYQNDINQDLAGQALMAVMDNGTPVCIDQSKGCKPIDVFSANGPSAEGLEFIYAPTFTRNEQSINVFNAFVSGDLGKYGITSPWADDGVAIVLGVESRKEAIDEKRDQTQLDAEIPEAHGKIWADEYFTEIEVPIVSDKPFIKSLNTSFGYRSSTYNSESPTAKGEEKKTETYKVEARYAPTSDILFRASYNKAMRAANVSELFASQQVGNVGLIDPCAGPTPAKSLEECARTGVTSAWYGHIEPTPADVGSGLGGGNPDLNPEEAKTTTYGLVFTPRGLPLAVSLDYYKIRIEGYIGTVDPQVAVSQCVNTGDSFYCGLIVRNPQTGALFGYNKALGGYVINTNINTGFLETTGVDVSATYNLETEQVFGHDYGSLSFSLVGTYLNSLETEVLPGLGSYDCTGLFGGACGQPKPKWRHNLRTTWAVPGDNVWAPTTVSINWRYFGKAELATNTDDQYLTGTKSTRNAEIEAYNYIDLAVTKNLPHGLVLRAGVNNVFDKDPPAIMGGLLVQNGNGNTFPSTYDPLGRMFFLGLSTSF